MKKAKNGERCKFYSHFLRFQLLKHRFFLYTVKKALGTLHGANQVLFVLYFREIDTVSQIFL